MARLPLAGLCAAIPLCVLFQLHAAISLADEAARYLPGGATLATISQSEPNGTIRKESVVATGAAAKPNSSDLALVYTVGGALFLKIVDRPSGVAAAADVPLPGSFVARARQLEGGILLKDVAGIGRKQVLVATSDGASLGVYLDIFAIDGGALKNLTNPVIGGNDIRLDCGREPPCTIITYGKWTAPSAATVSVYNWLGSGFSRTDKNADKYFSMRLDELAGSAGTEEPTPVPLRLSETNLAVDEYLIRKNYEAAQHVCAIVIKRLSDPTKSLPPASVKEGNIGAAFDTLLREAKASDPRSSRQDL